MHETTSDIESLSWVKSVRRWSLALLTMLAVNVSLVGLALTSRGSASASSTEPSGVATTSQPVAAQPAAVVAPQQLSQQTIPSPTAHPDEQVNVQPAPAGQSQTPPAETATQPDAPEPPPALSQNATAAPSPAIATVQPSSGPDTVNNDRLVETTQQPQAVQGTVTGNQAGIAQPQAAATEEIANPFRDKLVIINPPATGGAIHFAVDGVVFSLNPGEYHELTGAAERRVQFHRGDDFGDSEQRLKTGPHIFGIGDTGWTLNPSDGERALRLLATCRPGKLPDK